ncbi:chromobox protein homolog 5-like isoform X2 [Aphis gossypii]|uniref:chromobox protein homolog 5-like isoform X2 n=1 Tax=Aphis gossypii TaxID=80765 RepID=UPI002159A4F7|nr:chromobox protein homolog 5-like isoform X2 [Aphis gossypii]
MNTRRSEENENQDHSSILQYPVEKILHKRTKKGKVEYLLKWQGFNEFHNSWEPQKNLKCDKLIKNYAHKLKQKSEENQNQAVSSIIQYPIEKILHKRTKKGKVEYLVKWQGFNEFHNSWEPQKNLNCDELIENFDVKVKKENKKNQPECKYKLRNSTKTSRASSNSEPPKKC